MEDIMAKTNEKREVQRWEERGELDRFIDDEQMVKSWRAAKGSGLTYSDLEREAFTFVDEATGDEQFAFAVSQRLRERIDCGEV
jgi:hypothetical protein